MTASDAEAKTEGATPDTATGHDLDASLARLTRARRVLGVACCVGAAALAGALAFGAGELTPSRIVSAGPDTGPHLTTVRFVRSGVVEEVWVDDGDAVTRGSVLATLESASLEAERHAIARDIAAARAVLRRALENLSDQSSPRDDLRRRRAALETLNQSYVDVDTKLAASILRAPIDGVARDVSVQSGDVATAGRKVLAVASSSPPPKPTHDPRLEQFADWSPIAMSTTEDR